MLRPIAALTPTPRLLSADVPVLAEALPTDPAIPVGRASLRAILDEATVFRRGPAWSPLSAAGSRTFARAPSTP